MPRFTSWTRKPEQTGLWAPWRQYFYGTLPAILTVSRDPVEATVWPRDTGLRPHVDRELPVSSAMMF